MLEPKLEVLRSNKINHGSLWRAFLENAENYPNFEIIQESTTGLSINYENLKKRVLKIANYLDFNGFRQGDRVAIMSVTRKEWIEVDLAVLLLGGVVVPIYHSLNAEETGYILSDSGAKYVFAENQAQADKLRWLKQHGATLHKVEGRPPQKVKLEDLFVVTLEKVEGHNSYNEIHLNSETIIPPTGLISGDTIATIVYTSGTTGPPKGVVQTHGNFLSNIDQIVDSGLLNNTEDIMLFLPLAHSFARMMSFVGILTRRKLFMPTVIDRSQSRLDPAQIIKEIAVCGANVVPLVPRFLEKVREEILKGSEENSLKGIFLRTALTSTYPQIKNFLANKLRKKIFGERFMFAVSGGAKLNPDVYEFFKCLGVEVCEGFGLTETCVATNCNLPGDSRVGSVGRTLSDTVKMRVDSNGEILFKGPNISVGYWRRENATKESFSEDGWFRTGDLGEINSEGYLFVSGRIKELIVTAGGKKVSPLKIEAKLLEIRGVMQAILVGEGKPYCVALLVLRKDIFDGSITYNSLGGIDLRPHLKEEITDAVADINKEFSSYETVKDFRVLGEEMTVDNGLMTPTFKVKRKSVELRYANLIEEIYQNPSQKIKKI